MKVLHIITGLQDGGAEGVLYRLVTNDIDNEHHVISLTPGGKYRKLLVNAGCKVTSLNMKGFFSLFAAIWRLISILRKEQPSVVQTWMYHADLIGGFIARLFCEARVVWGIRHSNHSDASKVIRYLAVISAKLSTWIPYKIVCCSEVAAQHHQAIGYSTDKFVIIPNGYDFSSLRDVAGAKQIFLNELGLDSDTFLIGCVARWNEQKDHNNLLAALPAPMQNNFHCLLVGSGCTEDNVELTRLIEKYDLTDCTSLLGARNDIPMIMSALDLHVLPSSHGEAFPNVVAEAMACGTPCVVTDVGDAAMIVSEYGWVVSPRNSRDLSNAIFDALDMHDSNQLVSLGEDAKSSVIERFDITVMCNKFNQAWKDTSKLEQL